MHMFRCAAALAWGQGQVVHLGPAPPSCARVQMTGGLLWTGSPPYTSIRRIQCFCRSCCCCCMQVRERGCCQAAAGHHQRARMRWPRSGSSATAPDAQARCCCLNSSAQAACHPCMLQASAALDCPVVSPCSSPERRVCNAQAAALYCTGRHSPQGCSQTGSRDGGEGQPRCPGGAARSHWLSTRARPLALLWYVANTRISATCRVQGGAAAGTRHSWLGSVGRTRPTAHGCTQQAHAAGSGAHLHVGRPRGGVQHVVGNVGCQQRPESGTGVTHEKWWSGSEQHTSAAGHSTRADGSRLGCSGAAVELGRGGGGGLPHRIPS